MILDVKITHSFVLLVGFLEIISWFFYISAVECPFYPTPKDSSRYPDFDVYTYDTVVTHSCRPGAAFWDNSRVKTCYCQANAQWNAIVPPCYGKTDTS